MSQPEWLRLLFMTSPPTKWRWVRWGMFSGGFLLWLTADQILPLQLLGFFIMAIGWFWMGIAGSLLPHRIFMRRRNVQFRLMGYGFTANGAFSAAVGAFWFSPLFVSAGAASIAVGVFLLTRRSFRSDLSNDGPCDWWTGEPIETSPAEERSS